MCYDVHYRGENERAEINDGGGRKRKKKSPRGGFGKLSCGSGPVALSTAATARGGAHRPPDGFPPPAAEGARRHRSAPPGRFSPASRDPDARSVTNKTSDVRY